MAGIFAKPSVWSPVLQVVQSPPSPINLGLAVFCSHYHGQCMDHIPHRSPTASAFLSGRGKSAPALSLKAALLSSAPRTPGTMSLMRATVFYSWCILLCCRPSQSQANTKPGTWLEMQEGWLGKIKENKTQIISWLIIPPLYHLNKEVLLYWAYLTYVRS